MNINHLVPAALLLCSLPGFPQVSERQPKVSSDVRHGVSAPLSSMVPTGEQIPTATRPPTSNVSSTGPAIGLNFQGITSNGTNVDPDPDVAVGATQVVQVANPKFAVYDKTTGTLVGGPYNDTAPWTSLGGPCSTYAGADTIVDYDKSANQWVLSRHASPTGGPFYECFAVSVTSDATGSWYVYQFQVTTDFPDYQRFGIWPDAYYITEDDLDPKTYAYLGVTACALQRSEMLIGGSAQSVCFNAPSGYLHLIPSDLDGPTPPPKGTPNYLMNWKSNELNLFQFHVDFTNTSNSTFTGPTALRVAGFRPACSGGHCVPQPGTTEVLDSVSDRLMNRVAYRKFKGYDTLVVSHSVLAQGTSPNGPSGIRWYEIRNPATNHRIYQQATFAPDANYRWLPSIAEDAAGDIAIGYSISSSTVKPGIRFAARLSSDPLNTMESEQDVLDGPGVEMGNFRWGAYAGMAIDPVDDCTFWFTTEYQPTDGNFNWSTQIVSFKFPGCAK